MTITCVIVEDEPASQDVLKKYIDNCPNLKLVGICNNAIEANNLLQDNHVQLMFLDINMPLLSGMKFYQSLANPPYVIFTTAYTEYAVEGFEVNAIDYLLKPFPFERFLRAVNKLADKLRIEQSPANNDFIMLNSDKKLYKVDFNDIYCVESMGDYLKVFYNQNFLIVHDTMQRMQNQLPKNQFARIHKSFIIAMNKIEYVEGNCIKISNKYIPIGQTYRNIFFELLKNFAQRG